MVSEATRSLNQQSPAGLRQDADHAFELKRDVVDYLTAYARENPGCAALWCLGVGFVLGWKLKPW